MIARGDLGVEIAAQLVPVVQKNIIRRCNAVGKMVITSTQMLESMINNPVPTRAEASDVANAVMDGADIVMLSGETAIGQYPVKAVKMMDDILITAEAQSQFIRQVSYDIPQDLLDNVFDSTGKAFTEIANQLNAKAIVVFSKIGKRAEIIAKFRPRAPIYAFSDNEKTVTKMNMLRGVYPFKLLEIRDTEIAANGALLRLRKENLVEKGDLVIFMSGEPKSQYSRDSWMRFLYIS
jgi:pyruvate kinase